MISQITLNDFKQWLVDHNIQANFISDRVFEVAGTKFLLTEPKFFVNDNPATLEEYLAAKSDQRRCLTLQSNLVILCNDEEEKELDNVSMVVFKFGSAWYYTEDETLTELNEFKYIGQYESELDYEFPYLGIHGSFDLYNGSGDYKDWCKNAKFLGVKTLGICEDNTLAGTLSFQAACEKTNIKPIIGETITVLSPDRGKYTVKLYCINEQGWKELLRVNSVINVENEGHIDESVLLSRKTENLICVIGPEVEIDRCYNGYKKAFKHLYYQVDFVEWDSQSRDEKWLQALKLYFDKYLKKLPPVLICDSYYLFSCDSHIRKSLNTIGRKGFKNQSKNQYFKTIDEVYHQAAPLFKDDDKFFNIFDTALKNLKVIEELIQFKIPTAVFRLPEYQMTGEEAALYEDNDALFWALIEQGLEKKITSRGIDDTIYLERIEKETKVINKGGYISYFLALADVVNWCKKQGIWVGVGRGSAAGCLISYLLNIVKLDPIEYKLLFERFLNEGRLGKSLPDIDTDFQGERRDEVKRYLEERYGEEYVTSIGTYGTFKARAGVKALARELGVDHQKTNYITTLIDADSSFFGIFEKAISMQPIKEYIQKYPKVIDKLPLILDQPNNSSMHAAGVVVVPKEYGSIYEQIPVKKIDGVLVSEWEGEYIDKAGFLKMDILGIKQLDKFAAIARMIKEFRNIDIDLEDIKFDEPGVYNFFAKGFTEDVFQFGATGLKAYCKELKPDNIEDLIATVALYRPGPIETGMYKKYIKVKNGLEQVTYDRGTEEITEPTFGQIIYQEQIMEVFTHVGGFSLVQADDMRKTISKTTISRDERLKSLKEFMDRFYSQGQSRGYTHEELEVLWLKIEKFATYSFNRSHAACYAVTGYYCQWFKFNFPLEFWTIALQYTDKDEKIVDRISEITKTSSITVSPVDVNKSTLKFHPDPKTNIIYWSINSVKWVGEKAVQAILDEREKNGLFFSIEDFCDRLKGKTVNKRCIVNLILSGAFDEIERIQLAQRFKVLEKYFKFTGVKISEELEETRHWKDYEWTLRQKQLTGMGYVNYEKIVEGSKQFKSRVKSYRENKHLLASDDLTGNAVIAGILLALPVSKPYKDKVRKYLRLEIQDNTDTISVMVWDGEYKRIADILEQKGVVGRMVLFYGKINYFNGVTSIHSIKESDIEII